MAEMTSRSLLPPHLSYSSLSEWLKCGKLYQLSRVLGLPERPAWWNLGGRAVHSATEAHDRAVYTATGA